MLPLHQPSGKFSIVKELAKVAHRVVETRPDDWKSSVLAARRMGLVSNILSAICDKLCKFCYKLVQDKRWIQLDLNQRATATVSTAYETEPIWIHWAADRVCICYEQFTRLLPIDLGFSGIIPKVVRNFPILLNNFGDPLGQISRTECVKVTTVFAINFVT